MVDFRKLDDEPTLSEMMPIDVMPASNGEFIPPPPTREQYRIMELQDDVGEELRSLGRRLSSTDGELAELRTLLGSLHERARLARAAS